MTENKFRTYFENNADAIVIFDEKTHFFIDCNPAMIEKYGYTKKELLQMRPEDLHQKRDLERVICNIHDREDPSPHTYTHITKSGKHITIEIKTKYFLYLGKPAWISTIRDISLRRVTENELEKQNRLQKAMLRISEASRESDLKVLFETIHEQIKKLMPAQNFYIALLEDYETCLYSFPYYKDLNNQDGLAQGMTIDLPGSFTDWVTKNKSLLLNKDIVKKILSGKINIHINTAHIGVRSSSWMGVQLKGRKKTRLGAIVVQDYNDPNAYSEADFNILKIASETIGSAIQYNQAQIALEKSEKMFRTLVETASVGINETDLNETIIYSNKVFSRMMGYENEFEIIGKNLKEFTSPETFAQMVEKTRTERLKGIPGRYETQFISKEGNLLDVILNCTPVRDEKNEVSKCIVVLTDITEQKLAHKEKIIAQKHAADQEKHALVGQIAGKMAHDFNNILGAIMGNAEISLMDCEDETLRKTLEIILEQTFRGRNLTKNLVAFAKDQEPRQEFFIINDKINLALNLLKKDLEHIVVKTDFQPDIPPLLADPGMIEHALMNLIQNSIHATSKIESPVITIKTFHSDGNILFEIEDNGCGIPKQHRDSIYTPGFTLKGSNDLTDSYRNNIKGTGYGMSNVRMYVEKHHGTISFTSEENKGTRFRIELPVKMTGLTDKEILEVLKTDLQTGKNILIVEDEDTISKIQARVMMERPFEHHVDIAVNGRAAIEYLKKKKYDLVSLDYVLPGDLTGMDVYHYIRQKDTTVPVLFISGNLEFIESIKELRLNDKSIGHLSKPSTNKDYAGAINELLTHSIRDHGTK
ncbi:MAG: PAS domain S-box protein [Desulfobacula sp.]|jgi:PAS domain S-box-containing protein